jgi:hypothetical protein
MFKKCMFLASAILMYSGMQLFAAPASVENIRYQATKDYTRVIIELDSNARYAGAKLSGPDRIFFDISNAKLSSDFRDRALAVKHKSLKQLRVAQYRSDVVRVVLDISGEADYITSELQNPFRIVVDLSFRPGTAPGLNDLANAPTPGPEMEINAVSQPDPAAVSAVLKDQELPAQPEANAARAPGSVAEPEPMQSASVEALASPRSAGVPAAAVPNQDPEPAPSPKSGIIAIKPDTKNQDSKKSAQPSANGQVGEAVHRSEMERPLTIDGTLSTGYYSSYTSGGVNEDQSIDFVPLGGKFDINGYYMTPDVLEYYVGTELNTGSQAMDAGFEGGNGISTRITSFRRGAIPLTFRYSNVQLKDVYFGSLTQLSSYTLENRNKDLGVTAGLQIPSLPAATVDWGSSSVRSKSFSPGIPDYVSSSDHLSLNCSDRRWGWDFQCFAGRQTQTSDLFTPRAEGTSASLLRQAVTQFRGSARRSFLRDSELYFDGGSQSTANVVLSQPIDLTTRYANANLRLFQRRRWKTSLRAGYMSNISGLLLTQLVDGLSGNGSIAPDQKVLQRFQRTTSYLSLNGTTSVDLSRGLSLFGSLDRTAVLSGDSRSNSKYLMTGSGVAYSHTFHWGNLSGQYGRSFGVGSGETRRIVGQDYFLTVQPGNPNGLQFDFSVRGNDQRFRNEIPAREHSFASDMGAGFGLFGRLRARLGGGWQNSAFSNQGNEFRTRGYTARAGIESQRFQLNGSLNSSAGNILQAYSQVLGGVVVGSTFLVPLRMVPSDFRGITVTLHLVPMRRLEFSGLYTRSVQHLEGVVANDFEVLDVSATFYYHKLQFVAGFFTSSQIYSSNLAIYPQTERGRYYIRVLRPVKFL